MQFTPLPSWQIATSGHFFATLSPKPQLAIASNGHRFTTRSNYIWNCATILILQHKLHKKPKNKPKKGYGAAEVVCAMQNSFKCKIDHKLTHYWWTHLELQYTRYTFLGKKHHGYALSSRQKWKGDRWQLTGKVIYFKTQSYATRLYFYLPNPLYSGTLFQPYYGHGIAITWLVYWRPIGPVRLELNYTFIYSIKDFDKKSSPQTSRPSQGKQNGTIQLLVRY